MAEVHSAVSAASPSPLALLLRVNVASMWRRLLSLKGQSRLLTSVICLFVPGYLVVAFWLFFKGLKFVYRFPGMGTLLMERLLFLLFAFLFALLLSATSLSVTRICSATAKPLFC